MTEDFAISFASEELQLLSERTIPPDLAEEVRRDFEELHVPCSEIRLETGSAGYGAEIMTLIVILASAFLLGKQIDEGLSAWANIGRRVRGVVQRLKKKYGSVAVSEPVALMLVLQEMAELGISLEGLSVVATHTLPVAKGVVPPELVADFRYQPDRFYVFVLRTDDQDTYLVCVRSSGETVEIRRLPTGNWQEFIGIQPASEERDPNA